MKNLSILLSVLSLPMAIATPVAAEIMTAPSGLGSVRAFPNPWKSNQHSAIGVTIDRLPENAVSTVRIFTIAGELVRTMSGTESVSWDMRNDSGQNVASGIYLYLAQVNGDQRTGKIAVIR
jgi:hypothetical protein